MWGSARGRQKLFFLPEAHTDFVLALVGEELGLVGSVTISAELRQKEQFLLPLAEPHTERPPLPNARNDWVI